MNLFLYGIVEWGCIFIKYAISCMDPLFDLCYVLSWLVVGDKCGRFPILYIEYAGLVIYVNFYLFF